MAISRMATKWNIENWTKKEYMDLEKPSVPDELLTLFALKKQFTKVFSGITYSIEEKIEYEKEWIKETTYGNLHIIEMKGKRFLVTHPHLAGTRDIVNAWFSSLLYSWLCGDS